MNRIMQRGFGAFRAQRARTMTAGPCARRIAGRSAGASDGMALIEAALLLPMVLLLVMNVANFGVYIYAFITLNNAARAAVQYAVYNGTTIQFSSQAGFANIKAMTNTEVSSLPNYAASVNPTLRVCRNKNGTVTCNVASEGTGGSCAGVCAAPVDPNPAAYDIYYAEVVYSYTPIFAAFNIPFFNIALTLPASSIHGRAAMRSMK